MRKSLQSFKRVIAEYGVVALVIHYVIFAIVIVGAYLAMNAGWQPSGRMSGVGTWAAAYVVAKITQPVRLIVTVALAPLVARLYTRLSGRDVRGKCPVMPGGAATPAAVSPPVPRPSGPTPQ